MKHSVKKLSDDLRKEGFMVDHEWDPHNVTNPFVTIYIRGEGDPIPMVRKHLGGWTIDFENEDGAVVVEAKPPISEAAPHARISEAASRFLNSIK